MAEGVSACSLEMEEVAWGSAAGTVAPGLPSPLLLATTILLSTTISSGFSWVPV